MKCKQTINCDVRACKYHDNAECCCNLNAITVSPTKDCKTAHFCSNYVEK